MSPSSPVDYSRLDKPEVLAALFHPRPLKGPVDGGGRFQEIRMPVTDDIHVGARFHMTHKAGPTILFFHGNGEIAADYDEIGPLFTDRSINLIAADYRGYGCSDGSPTVAAMMADCHGIFDFVATWLVQNGYAGPMIVMGRSLGSASALELAAAHEDRIDGLVIESGFAWAGPLLRLLGVRLEGMGVGDRDGFANVDKIRKFTKPTRIIHAEFDHIIPFADGKALFDASPAADKVLVEIPGANHNDIFVRGLDRYLDTISILAQTLLRTA